MVSLAVSTIVDQLAGYSMILYIGMSLSVLTYYLGVLLVSMPFPLYSIKKWGYTLIEDGLISFLLILLTGFIISVVDYFGRLLGSDKPSFINYLLGWQDNVLIILIMLRGLASLLGISGIGFLSAFLYPLISIATMTLSTLAAITVVSLLVFNYAGFFISLGSLLYALPFRIGRTAGASIIAFTVIFNIGLPLMPAWTSMFEEQIPLIYYGHTIPSKRSMIEAYGCLRPIYGFPEKAVIIVEGDKGTRRVYITDSRGCFSSRGWIYGLYKGESYRLDAIFLGKKLKSFHINIDPSLSQDNINFTIILDNYGFINRAILVDVSSCKSASIIKYSYTEYAVNCKKVSEETIIEVIYPSNCIISLIGAINVSKASLETSNYKWLGIDVTRDRYVLEIENDSQDFSLLFRVSDCVLPQPKISELMENYGIDTKYFSEIIIFISYKWIVFFISSLAYISILSMITYGLAYALGAWRPRIPFPFV